MALKAHPYPGHAIIGTTEAVIQLMFGAEQQDNHVRRWRWFKYAGV